MSCDTITNDSLCVTLGQFSIADFILLPIGLPIDLKTFAAFAE
jgi:hypothetical protein